MTKQGSELARSLSDTRLAMYAPGSGTITQWSSVEAERSLEALAALNLPSVSGIMEHRECC